MKKAIVCSMLSLTFSIPTALGAELRPPQNQVANASPVITVPVMTNAPGALGGVFKTKVVIFNPTIFSFPVEVSLYGTNGFLGKTNISLAAGQVRNYENFLAEVFSYTGAGTVNFDSLSLAGGNSNLKFLVSAEVYMDSDRGRFKTVVSTGAPLDPVGPGPAPTVLESRSTMTTEPTLAASTYRLRPTSSALRSMTRRTGSSQRSD